MQIKSDLGAESIREKLTNISPFLIITCFVLSLLSFGVLKYSYQVNLFNEDQSSISVPIAILIALVSQLGRLAFGLVGVRDLVRGNKIIGALGILASIAITAYEHMEVTRMVESWGNEEMWYPIVFLVWIALVFELRLMMTMNENRDLVKEEEERIAKAEQKEADRREAERQRMQRNLEREFKLREQENEMNRRTEYFKEREARMQATEAAYKAKLEKDRKDRAAEKKQKEQLKETKRKEKLDAAKRKAAIKETKRKEKLAEKKRKLDLKQAKRTAKLAAPKHKAAITKPVLPLAEGNEKAAKQNGVLKS